MLRFPPVVHYLDGTKCSSRTCSASFPLSGMRFILCFFFKEETMLELWSPTLANELWSSPPAFPTLSLPCLLLLCAIISSLNQYAPLLGTDPPGQFNRLLLYNASPLNLFHVRVMEAPPTRAPLFNLDDIFQFSSIFASSCCLRRTRCPSFAHFFDSAIIVPRSRLAVCHQLHGASLPWVKKKIKRLEWKD